MADVPKHGLEPSFKRRRPTRIARLRRSGMPLNAVIFDVEGTLVDCVPQILDSWHRVLTEAGHSVTRAELQRHSGMDGGDMLSRLLPTIERPKRNRSSTTRAVLPAYLFTPCAAICRDGRVVWRAQTSGLQARNRNDVQGRRASTYDKKLGVLKLVDAVACGDDRSKGKPHPDLFYEALRKLGVTDASRVVAVGDTPYAALAARPLGLQVTGVLSGGFSREALVCAGCTGVVATVADLHTYLGGDELGMTSSAS